MYRFNPKFDWWTKDHEVNFGALKQIYSGKNDLQFLEIGVYEGRSTVWFLDHVLTGKNCLMVCVEPDMTSNGERNLSHHKNVFIHREYSETALPKFIIAGAKFDFIYVDGDHNAQGVLHDIVLSWKLLKVGGILLMDDYEMEAVDPWHYASHAEMTKYPRINFRHPHVAIDAFLSIYRGMYEKVFDNFQIGVRKITDLGGKNLNAKPGTFPQDFSYIAKR
jgi:predicted O-methyltransferase YrrM